MVAALRTLGSLPRGGRARRIHFTFFRRPVAVVGHLGAESVLLEATEGDNDHSKTDRPPREVVDAGLVLTSVGYRAEPLPGGLPFDPATATVPHTNGWVFDGDDTRPPAVYVAGWLKRGPTGVIGTNRRDSLETVNALLLKAADFPRALERNPGAVVAMLRERGVEVVPWDGWNAIDSAEEARGESLGRARVKIHRLDELLQVGSQRATE